MDVSSVIPNAAQGIHVLLVDRDASCLALMKSVLEEQSYKVTTTEMASNALSLIRGGEVSYDLVIAEVDLLDMSGITLLNQILLINEEISVILMMSSSGDMEVATKALAEGACFFLFKPVCPQDLAKVWQHVFRKRGQRTKQPNAAKDKEDQSVQEMEKSCDANQEDNAQEIIRDPVKGKAPCTDDGEGEKGRKKAAEDNVEKLVIGGNDKRASDESVHKRKNVEEKTDGDNGKTVEKGKEKKTDEDKGKGKKSNENKRKNGQKRKAKKSDEETSSPEKKARMMWTPVLHEKFIQAVAKLGEDKAQPKALLREMAVSGLSHRHIASHLQKYRKQLTKIREQLLKNPSSSFDPKMNGKPTPPPQSTLLRNTRPMWGTILMSNPIQHSPSLHTSTFGPPPFAPPQTNLNGATSYYQMDTLKNLFATSTTNLPWTSNNNYFHANYGNQVFPQLNQVPNSSDPTGKQVVPSFGGYNGSSNIAPANNSGMNNIDAQIEALKKALADVLGSDEKLHQEIKLLTKYNNVVPQSSQQQEKEQQPSVEQFSAAGQVSAPAETEVNEGQQSYIDEGLPRISDDSSGGDKDVVGPSSEPPVEPPSGNNMDDDDIMEWINEDAFTELLKILPDDDSP